MKLLSTLFLALFTFASMHAAGPGQQTGAGLDPAVLLHPTPDSWPTYNGGYSGRRFSTLTQINDKNVKSLSLAWLYQLPNMGSLHQTSKIVR
jgi:alcohol dehydrogenase (cytochrome c)